MKKIYIYMWLFAADINLLNVAELRGVLRPRSKSMTHASVGSARRKAPKMSIVRFIQAVRAPNSSTGTLGYLCPTFHSALLLLGLGFFLKEVGNKSRLL